MSSVISAVSAGFMPAVGSSSSSSAGSLARARAISRRRWSPYGRFFGQLVVPTAQPDQRQPLASLGRRRLLFPRAGVDVDSRWSTMLDVSLRCIPTRTFSSAVMFWKSRMFWNVRPMPAGDMSFGRALRRIAEPSDEGAGTNRGRTIASRSVTTSPRIAARAGPDQRRSISESEKPPVSHPTSATTSAGATQMNGSSQAALRAGDEGAVPEFDATRRSDR